MFESKIGNFKVQNVPRNKKSNNSIGDWLDKTYNNKETASILKTPKLNLDSPFGNDPYGEKSNKITTLPYYSGNPYSEKSNNIKTLPYYSGNPYESSKKSSNNSGSYASKAIHKSSPKAPKQYANQADYEKDKRKITTVENIQKSLNTLGYKYGDEGELKVDGDFGIKTQSNWNNFNSDRGSENHLTGIYLPPLSPLDYLDNKSFKIKKVPKNGVIEPANEDNILLGDDNFPELEKGVKNYKKAKNDSVLSRIGDKISDVYDNLLDDFTNYRSYKTKDGGHYNDDPKKVKDANYFSNYKGSKVLKWNDAEGAFSLGDLIVMSDVDDKNHDALLDHEYGHNLSAMEYGIIDTILNNELPSAVSFWSKNKNKPEYRDDSEGDTVKKGFLTPYYNQPWEILADKLGGNDYSRKIKDNDFEKVPGTNEYVDKYKEIKESPRFKQWLYMLKRDLETGNQRDGMMDYEK